MISLSPGPTREELSHKPTPSLGLQESGHLVKELLKQNRALMRDLVSFCARLCPLGTRATLESHDIIGKQPGLSPSEGCYLESRGGQRENGDPL